MFECQKNTFVIRNTQYSIALSVHRQPGVFNTTYKIQSSVNCLNYTVGRASKFWVANLERLLSFQRIKSPKFDVELLNFIVLVMKNIEIFKSNTPNKIAKILPQLCSNFINE